MVTVMACVLVSRHLDWPSIDRAGWGAMFAVAALSLSRLGIRECYLGGLSVVLAVVIWRTHPDPATTLGLALDQAAFMMAFILLLALLFEAATNSPAIRECGRYITAQPPGRRFLALFQGTGLMAVLFNLGVISLLVPLIRGGVRAANPDDPLNPVRERRQLVAVQRGFAWGVIWSPTALAPLTILELIPGIDRGRWILIGIAIATLAMLIGWVEDTLRFRHISRARTTPRPPPPRLPRSAILRFSAAFGWLLLLSLGFGWLFDDTIVFGLMVSCPVMMIGWLVAQNSGRPSASARRDHSLRQATRRASGQAGIILRDRLPLSASVAVTLACSGFIGRAAAALVPADALLAFSELDAIPDYLLLYLLPLAITGLSLIALSPIVTAVFLGSVLGNLSSFPADPTLIAVAISCGWALAMTISPFVTLVLLMVRTSGHDGLTLSVRWNLAYTSVSVFMLLPVFYILTGGR